MANPKHLSARSLVSQGIFRNLKSFSDLESRIGRLTTSKERGDALEVFAEAYFATQKSTQAKDVFPFEEIPRRIRSRHALGTLRDMGVDGVYETTLGALNAYQVKFRSGRPSLKWEELSTFMGLTEQVDERVLFTNCNDLPSLMNDRKDFFCIRGNDLDRLTKRDFEEICAWLESGEFEYQRKKPRKYQQAAVDAVFAKLQEQDRTTAVMACGTGKTLIALWIAEKIGGRNILVLEPSLALIRQTLYEWVKETSWDDCGFLCVCSDPTVTKQGADELRIQQSDLDFPVTTDPERVGAFLRSRKIAKRIVFSTYQSARVIAGAVPKSFRFDLGLFDEAHKTAGREGTQFNFALTNDNLGIRKRVFLTATPRHYDIRKKDKEGDAKLVYSMDVPESYGSRAYTLSFREAADKKIICDYKVLISVVTDEIVNDELLRRGEVVVEGDVVKARQVANQVALQKAVEQFGVNKIFTFHRSVASAKSFVSPGGEGIGAHLPFFETFHVNGAMPTAGRDSLIQEFREARNGVMTNARCLTEGVDVPAVDMVAFMSPKRSKVDIVQATGRAMRLDRVNPNKTTGYVLVPLFLKQDDGETVEEALERTKFDEVWSVLQAMQEQDDDLVDIIRTMREQRGQTGGYDDHRLREKLAVLGPHISLPILRKAITAQCVDHLGVTWDERLGELMAYKARFGDCNVPDKWSNNLPLAKWVSTQRSFKKRGELSKERIRRLDRINFVWDANAATFESNYATLVEYKTAHGDCNVPAVYPANRKLGAFVRAMRREYKRWKKCKKTREDFNNEDVWVQRFQRLDSLGFAWEVDVLWQLQWERNYAELVSHVKKHGHFDIPREKNRKLSNWMVNQRARRQRLSDKQTKLLDGIGFPWDAIALKWEKSFAEWQEWKKSSSDRDSRKPRKVTRWESQQRTRYQKKDKEQMQLERERRMLAAGFDFEARWKRH